MGARERQTLGALRYAVNEEAADYLAIMRLFTSGMSGFLSDQSAEEVAERLADLGWGLDRDLVDQRLSYLVEHGNLARSPREADARSLREYLANRARYQLTQRGELVHRQIEELLTHSDSAREVSSEMLPGILSGLEGLARLADHGLDDADPRDVAGRASTLFAQFELLVSSTRQFYTYLSQVLTRFDLGREEFEAFKSALLEYLQRFVDEISRHMPQVADRLGSLEPHLPALCARANAGERLVGLDGTRAKRAVGLEVDDWASLHAWFVGVPGRRADADNVRRLATDAMRSLLTNLRRIASGADRQQSRYGDLTRLATWFDSSDDDTAHHLWAAAFGLYSSRHLSFAMDADDDPVPATQSWWLAPATDVPVSLRIHGGRSPGGKAGARVDYSAAKAARLGERKRVQLLHEEAVRELARHAGPVDGIHLTDNARAVLLELYAQALGRHGRPLGPGTNAFAELRQGEGRLAIRVCSTPGAAVRITSPSGRLTLTGIGLELVASGVDEVNPARLADPAGVANLSYRQPRARVQS